MTVDVQIIEHKECRHCFQPIDRRAVQCPFCTSPQTIPRNRLAYLAAFIAVLLIGCLGFLWQSNERAQQARARLAVDLLETNNALEAVQSNQAANQAAREAASTDSTTARLRAITTQLQTLIRSAQAQSALIQSQCVSEPLPAMCSELVDQSLQDAIEFAALFGQFGALDAQDAFCDQLRPTMLAFSHLPSNPLGAEVHNRYYLATARCWSTGDP